MILNISTGVDIEVKCCTGTGSDVADFFYIKALKVRQWFLRSSCVSDTTFMWSVNNYYELTNQAFLSLEVNNAWIRLHKFSPILTRFSCDQQYKDKRG